MTLQKYEARIEQSLNNGSSPYTATDDDRVQQVPEKVGQKVWVDVELRASDRLCIIVFVDGFFPKKRSDEMEHYHDVNNLKHCNESHLYCTAARSDPIPGYRYCYSTIIRWHLPHNGIEVAADLPSVLATDPLKNLYYHTTRQLGSQSFTLHRNELYMYQFRMSWRRIWISCKRGCHAISR